MNELGQNSSYEPHSFCIEDLALVLVVEEFFDLSRRSNDLSVDLASALTGVVSGVAVDGGVDLAVELAHVVGVEDGDLISFNIVVRSEVLLVARNTGVGSCKSVEDLGHSSGVSASPAFFGSRIDNTLKKKC